MQIPISLQEKSYKRKDGTLGTGWIVSFKNDQGEWASSWLGKPKQNWNGQTYWPGVIDTTKEAWKPEGEDRTESGAKSKSKTTARAKNTQEEFNQTRKQTGQRKYNTQEVDEIISDDDLPF